MTFSAVSLWSLAKRGNCLPVDFNEKLFHRLVDYATAYHDGNVVFKFRNGMEVETKK